MKNIRSILVLLCMLPYIIYAQQALNTDLALPYLVRVPANASVHPPIIILMHGYGSNEEDLFELKDALPANFLVVSVRAPISMGGNSFQWFRMETVAGKMQANIGDLQNSIDKIKTQVSAIVKKYKADATHVYLSGFSQGGMMCYAVGLTTPQLFSGIAPLSGRIFEYLKPQIKPSSALMHLKIFIGHGDADNRVNYSQAIEARDYLKQLGLVPELHTYKGMQHSISKEELNDLVKWLGQK